MTCKAHKGLEITYGTFNTMEYYTLPNSKGTETHLLFMENVYNVLHENSKYIILCIV